MSSGQGAEAKGMVYTSVLKAWRHSNAMRQRAHVSWGTSAHDFVNWLELLRHTDEQTEQDLKAAWREWAERDPKAFQKAFSLVRKPFTDGKGVFN